MVKERSAPMGWVPLAGSYEEAVLSWHEQVDASFRQREALAARRRGPTHDGRFSIGRAVAPPAPRRRR